MMRAAFKRMINANFTWRRLVALLVGYTLIVFAIVSMMAWVHISLAFTIILWFAGLLALEWAG